MPRKSLTDPDGSKQKARQRAASTRAKKNLESFDVTDIVTNVADAVSDVADVVTDIVTAEHVVADSVKQMDSTVNRSELTSSDTSHAYQRATDLAANLGIRPIPVQEMLGSDPYSADGNIPEMSAKDANTQRLKIQRQNNALDVRLDKIKQGRKVLQLATEQTHLIGDVVQLHTARIETGSKVIDNQIADTNFRIKQSKLEQTEEILTQQQILTKGTASLTQGIRDEQELRYQKQQAKNDSLRLEIEGAQKENEFKRQELEAKLLDY